ncbi:MAG: alpha-amylase family glycosyl hydrolase [Armatimonadota bacterium]
MSIRLSFDKQTGAWNGLLVNGRQVAVASSVDVQANAGPLPFPSPAEWRLHSARREGGTVEVVRNAGEWQVRQVFVVDGNRIQRDVAVRWSGLEPIKIAGVFLRTPVLRLSDSMSEWWLIPGDFPVRRMPVSKRSPGRAFEERGWIHAEYGIALVHDPQSRLSVLSGYVFQVDQARVGVEEYRQGVVLRHGFETLAKLQPGQELRIGTQVIEVVSGDADAVLAQLARFSDSLGNGPPADVPRHLRGAVLYELHPWGRQESWWAGDRGNRFSRLTAQLPFLRALGVTTLWLLPPGHPPPWVYTTLGFCRVAPENGDPQQLKELVRQAHRLGMKVAVDLVVYGVHPDSEEVKHLPEDVWCTDERGEHVKVWSNTILAADVSHPAWQKRIAEVVTCWAKEYGFDGGRLDVMGWGQSPNWRNPLRANASVAYGGLQLNRVVRNAFRAVTEDGFILPEAGKPLAFRHADMLFDYPWYMVMREVTTQPDLTRWIRGAQEWLEWERVCYPRRALNGLVRFLENHDTVPAAQYFSVGVSQALMAICCLMQGVPLVYQEQEIGFSEELAKWLHLRQREKCLREGEAEYLSVQCSHPHVFAFLRRAEDGEAVEKSSPLWAAMPTPIGDWWKGGTPLPMERPIRVFM